MKFIEVLEKNLKYRDTIGVRVKCMDIIEYITSIALEGFYTRNKLEFFTVDEEKFYSKDDM